MKTTIKATNELKRFNSNNYKAKRNKEQTKEEKKFNFNYTEEEWSTFYVKSFSKYNRIYQVSNLGNVREVNSLTGESKKIYSYPSGGHPNGTKYECLSFNKYKYVHRLVAKAFVPNPFNYPVIDHIDEDKSNNHYTNLRWVTHSFNIGRRFKDDSELELEGVTYNVK